jgi:hypothetical protein
MFADLLASQGSAKKQILRGVTKLTFSELCDTNGFKTFFVKTRCYSMFQESHRAFLRFNAQGSSFEFERYLLTCNSAGGLISAVDAEADAGFKLGWA